MPVECPRGSWRACVYSGGSRVRGPLRSTSDHAAADLEVLSAASSESLEVLVATAEALRAEARAGSSGAVAEHPDASSFQTLAGCFSQWLNQRHCESLSRATPASRSLATRTRAAAGRQLCIL